VTPAIAITAAGYGVATAGVFRVSPRWQHIGYVIVLAVMVAARQPIGAFAVAVLWAAYAFTPPARGAKGWLVVSLLAAAIAFTQ
jgi:hypothetical protein